MCNSSPKKPQTSQEFTAPKPFIPPAQNTEPEVRIFEGEDEDIRSKKKVTRQKLQIPLVRGKASSGVGGA